MPAAMAIELSANWSKVAGALKVKRPDAVLKSLVASVASRGRLEAQAQLDAFVYRAPLPPSAGPGYRRTGRTRRGARMRAATWNGREATAEVYIDRSANRAGFYYPVILNRGRTDINYAPRPFWDLTRANMETEFRRGGYKALGDMRIAFGFK